MNLFFTGICGTFMAGIAQIARSMGHEVSGCDANVYPPMSEVLAEKGIKLTLGYEHSVLPPKTDLVVMGNAMKRGMPVVESILNKRIPYVSAPQWLAENVLPQYRVICVSGTHGKTTTTSMIAWILSYAGLDPSFLIAGVARNFTDTAYLGQGEYFVIEADEYDSAFFDKRPKFIHYRPEIAVLNNLEFDHADIYPTLEAIKQQFHFLMRTIPGNGLIVYNAGDKNLADVLERGCWALKRSFHSQNEADYQAVQDSRSGLISCKHEAQIYSRPWSITGRFNQENAMAAVAVCHHLGVDINTALNALTEFQSVQRRMELVTVKNTIHLYDDFAHHPTAIAATLAALKEKHKQGRLIAIIEFGSYTMRQGLHGADLGTHLTHADAVFALKPEFNLIAMDNVYIVDAIEPLILKLKTMLKRGDVIVAMSNKANQHLMEQLSLLLQHL